MTTTPRWLKVVLAAIPLVFLTVAPAGADASDSTGTTMPAQPASGGGTEALADCIGCYAQWGLWENANTIRAKRASYTNETVDFIHVHWAFIMPDAESCDGADMYEGEYASFGFKEKHNSSLDQIKDSNYGQGGQHHWTNAGAHRWIDDGAAWETGENGQTDICKDFGF